MDKSAKRPLSQDLEMGDAQIEMVGDSLDNWLEKGRLATLVSQRSVAFWSALTACKQCGLPIFPLASFLSLLEAVKRYNEATDGDPLVHRNAACAVSGLVASIRLAGIAAPEKVLEEASRLQLWFNRGIDPRLVAQIEAEKAAGR